MINYIDTVTMNYILSMYAKVPKLPPPWRFKGTAKEPQLHHWFLKDGPVYMAYYPDLFGHAKLFVTFSIPRLFRGHNTFNVTNFDETACYSLLLPALMEFPWLMFNEPAPPPFQQWMVSRLDLFLMRQIPLGEREECMDAYSLLMLSGYRARKYKNTYYLNSSQRPDKKSNKVFRVYPKAQEIHDRLTGEDYPLAVHKQHEAYLSMDDTVADYIRFEWMLRRSVLMYECRKQNTAPTMHVVLQQQFQESVLERLISAVGLDRSILSRADFKKAVKPLFKTGKTYQNALQLARQVRNGQGVTLTKCQAARVKKILKDSGIHFITTPYISLAPVALQKP